MTRTRTLRPPLCVICLVVAALIATSGCNGSPRASESGGQPEIQLPTLVHEAGKPEMMSLAPQSVPGLTFTTIKTVELPGTLLTSGQVTFDDRRVANIISRVAGRIEEVRVSQWDYVHRGQPIATLYSPDIMTAEAEYLQSTLMVSKLHGTEDNDFGRSMLEASRRKLELLGIGPDQIAAIQTAAPSFVMRAPISGSIVQNQALRGSAVNPGDVLYSLGTLDEVWITADIYEDDLARVKVGQELEAVTVAYPDEVFHGTIARISPNIDPNTHTVQIRCEVKNPDSKLKPQMLARVTIIVRPGEAVLVPLDALIFETDHYFAYVAVGNNLLERRQVTIGNWDQEGYARVIAGLQVGDRVVTNQTIQVNALWHQSHGESS